MQAIPYSHRSDCCAPLHIIPPFLSIAVNITTIAFAILYKNLYLMVPAGTGILCSFHSIFVAQKILTLSNFSQNNRELAQQVSTLATTKQELESEVQRLQESNTTFANNLTESSRQVVELRTLKEEQAAQFREQILALDKSLQEQQAHCEEQQTHISLLVEVGAMHLEEFGLIKAEFGAQGTTFSEDLETFKQGLADLKGLQGIKDKMVEWQGEVRKLVERDNRFIEDRRKDIDRLREQKNALDITIAKSEATASAVSGSVEELKTVKRKLSEEVKHLSKQRERLEVVSKKLESSTKDMKATTS